MKMFFPTCTFLGIRGMHAIQLTQKKSKSVLQLPKSYKFDTRVDYGVGMHIG